MEVIEQTTKCLYCGAEIENQSTYCPFCGKENVSKPYNNKQKMIGDYSIEIFSEFIGNNMGRYIRVFKPRENQKHFLHMNWAAFFFGAFWFFYRKMYKQGIILMIISAILSCSTGVVLKSIYKDDIASYTSIIEQNNYEQGNFPDKETQLIYLNAVIDLLNVNKKINILSLLPNIIVFVISGLTADSIYLNHIRRKISSSDGGTSVGSIFLTIPVLALVGGANQLVLYLFN